MSGENEEENLFHPLNNDLEMNIETKLLTRASINYNKLQNSLDEQKFQEHGHRS